MKERIMGDQNKLDDDKLGAALLAAAHCLTTGQIDAVEYLKVYPDFLSAMRETRRVKQPGIIGFYKEMLETKGD